MRTNSPVNTHLYAHRLVQRSNIIREVCLWSRQWLMQQPTTNQSAEDSLPAVQAQPGHLYHTPLPQGLGSFISEEVTEREKSQRSGRDRSRTVSSRRDRAASLVTSEQLCSCLHKACSSTSQPTLQFGVGRHSRISTLSWKAIDSW